MIKGLAPTEYWRLVPNYILLNYLILMLYHYLLWWFLLIKHV